MLYLFNFMNKLSITLAVQGDKSPNEYIRIAKTAEEYEFDKIYVYDDLFYYPAYPILSVMAQHTQRIHLGACLNNGFFRHPAILASNYAFLHRLIGNRAVMGIGRGAFFDLLGLNDDEAFTRKGFEETIALVHHFLLGNKQTFTGEVFKASHKAFLKIPLPENPQIVTATWNVKMAKLAGIFGTQLQIAEVWEEHYMMKLFNSYHEGAKESGISANPHFSIGGMICMGHSEKEALDKARPTVAVYLPYLQTILKNQGINPDDAIIQKIGQLSKEGKISEAAKLIPDDIVKVLSLVGTPEQIAERVKHLKSKVPISGLMFSPPYGVKDSIEKNIKFLKEDLLPLL